MSFDHAVFVIGLKERFPELVGELEDETWAGLLHLEAAAFARYAQAAVDRGDRVAVERCWAFANSVFRDCTSDVKNAVYVSFLERLNFEDQRTKRGWALEIMPEPLKAGWFEINEYLEALFSPREPGNGVETAKPGPKPPR